MNHRVVFLQESDKSPLGKAWRQYWNERNRDKSRKARRYISREKSIARRRMHRKIRRDSRRALKGYSFAA